MLLASPNAHIGGLWSNGLSAADSVYNARRAPIYAEACDRILAHYREHKLDHTIVYEGIREALEKIQSNGHPPKMAVLSNKPVHPSRAIVEALGLGKFFVRVYGGNSFQTKKPDPLGITILLKETATSPGEATMIGDSAIDVLTGRNAGLATCGVTYGFQPETLKAAPPDVVVGSPRELGEMFG